MPRSSSAAQVEIIVTDALDGAAVRHNRSLIEHALTSSPEDIVVDLTRCGAIDAEGIAFLADLHRQMQGIGGRLVLRGLSDHLYVALREAQIEEVLQAAAPPAGYRAKHRLRRHGPAAPHANPQTAELPVG